MFTEVIMEHLLIIMKIELIAKQVKEWCKNNKEKITEYQRAYRKNNKDKILEYQRSYRANKNYLKAPFQISFL